MQEHCVECECKEEVEWKRKYFSFVFLCRFQISWVCLIQIAKVLEDPVWKWRGEEGRISIAHFFSEATSGFGCRKGQMCKCSGNNFAHPGEARGGRADREPPARSPFVWWQRWLLLTLCGAWDCFHVKGQYSAPTQKWCMAWALCTFLIDAENTGIAWYSWVFAYWKCNHEIPFPVQFCICPSASSLWVGSTPVLKPQDRHFFASLERLVSVEVCYPDFPLHLSLEGTPGPGLLNSMDRKTGLGISVNLPRNVQDALMARER